MKRWTTSLLLVALACTFGLLGGGIVMYIRSALASRNSAGTYSLASSPVTTLQTISTSLWNNTFADLATGVTDSLDRNGRGGMLAALRGIDGTVAAPAFAYTSETGSGEYRIGAGDLGWAISGGKKLELTSSLFTVTPNAGFSGVLLGSNGAVGSPSYSFTNDATAGLYRAGSGDLRMAIGGADKTFWNANGVGVGAAAATNQSISVKGIGNHGYIALDTDSPTTKETGINLLSNGVQKWEMYIPQNTTDLRWYSAGDRLTITSTGAVSVPGSLAVGATGTTLNQLNYGQCTLNGGTPATCTATVVSGARCVANIITSIAANTRDVGTTVSGTTATFTSSGNGDAFVVAYLCFG